MTDERLTMNGADGPPPDDLDRLMARLESPRPPARLIPAILAHTVETAPAFIAARQRIRMILWACYGLTLALVLVCALSLGNALHATGALDILSFAVHDSDLARQSPGLFWGALIEHLPWWHLAFLVGALAAWAIATIALLRRRATPAPPAGMSGQTVRGAAR